MNNYSQTEKANALASEIRAKILAIANGENIYKLQTLFQAFLLDRKADDPKTREAISYSFFWILLPVMNGDFDLDNIALQINQTERENLKMLLDCYWLSDFVDGTERTERLNYSNLVNTLLLVVTDMQEYTRIRR